MKGLKITGIIAVILIGAILIVGMTIDGIVESGIEDAGSSLLKTEVEVDDIDISIFGGSANMDGFIVYNPEGFSDEAAISLKGIEIELDIRSLLSETIIIKRIHVKKPEIFFEQKGSKVNLRELSKNISLSSEDESEKAVIIEQFILEEGKVTILSELEKERNVEASIDRIELNNIGESGSNTVQQAMRQILEPIIQNAIAEAVKSGLLDQLKNAVEDLIDF
tara:strand:+ start:1427 stop:2092 length:666 start_codon:yes stop_codon:yes gene_type:complete